jgi:DNA-binding transcriptional MocR family regulator
MDKEELKRELAELKTALDSFKGKNLKLNMARGKPCTEQLDLTTPMMDVLTSKSDLRADNGTDCRNYGDMSGISDAKKLFGEYMGVSTDEIMIGGSSSLDLMYNAIVRALLKGTCDSDKPWIEYPKIKFICPVPGYDRHFAICEFFGIEMVNVPLYEDGPDMDEVERIAASDECVKGMWNVPKYSNPLGKTYSDETVRRLANMKTAAKDFRIFWDNAYAVHVVYKENKLLNLLDECKKAGNPNRAYMYGSTSKITFPGSGVTFFAASEENMKDCLAQAKVQTIGWDKLNMLRHVRYFKDFDGIKAHMEEQAEVMRAHFDEVINQLESEITPRGAGSFVKPDGGYFITFIAEPGCATRIIEICKECGVTLTPAGAMHPYHKDPDDKYIRIAPTSPTVDELRAAMEIFCLAIRYAYVEKKLA